MMRAIGILSILSRRAARLKISHCSGSMLGSLSIVDRYRALVFRIGPTIVGDERRPTRAARVLVVRISAEAPVEFVILGELVAIQAHAEAGRVRHADGAAFILHEAAFDDVVGKVMV